MTESFNVRELPNSTVVLVTGLDSEGVARKAKLDGAQLAGFAAHVAWREATDKYDAVVDEHFAEITAAAEELEKATLVGSGPARRKFILEEGTEGVAGKPERSVEYTDDSLIIEALKRGRHSDVTWFGDELIYVGA